MTIRHIVVKIALETHVLMTATVVCQRNAVLILGVLNVERHVGLARIVLTVQFVAKGPPLAIISVLQNAITSHVS